MPDEGPVDSGLRIGRWLPSAGSADPDRAGASPALAPPPDGPADAPVSLAPGPVVGPGPTDATPRRRILIGAVALTALLLPVSVLGGQWGDDPTATGLPSTGPTPGVTTPSPTAPSATEPAGSPSSAPASSTGTTPTTPSPTRPPAVVVNTRLGLEPVTAPGFLVRHRNFVGRIDRIGPRSAAVDRADSSFTVRTGLSDPRCVSFEAVNFPGFFLRHQNFVIRLHRRDGTALFAADATFCAVPGLSGRDTSFQSANFRDRFLVHRGQELHIGPVDGAAATRAAMTFAVRPALARPLTAGA